jgi:hypothetical protein
MDYPNPPCSGGAISPLLRTRLTQSTHYNVCRRVLGLIEVTVGGFESCLEISKQLGQRTRSVDSLT